MEGGETSTFFEKKGASRVWHCHSETHAAYGVAVAAFPIAQKNILEFIFICEFNSLGIFNAKKAFCGRVGDFCANGGKIEALWGGFWGEIGMKKFFEF